MADSKFDNLEEEELHANNSIIEEDIYVNTEELRIDAPPSLPAKNVHNRISTEFKFDRSDTVSKKPIPQPRKSLHKHSTSSTSSFSADACTIVEESSSHVDEEPEVGIYTGMTMIYI